MPWHSSSKSIANKLKRPKPEHRGNWSKVQHGKYKDRKKELKESKKQKRQKRRDLKRRDLLTAPPSWSQVARGANKKALERAEKRRQKAAARKELRRAMRAARRKR